MYYKGNLVATRTFIPIQLRRWSALEDNEQLLTATGFILQHRFFANFTCLSSLLRYFKPLKNINIGRRH